MRPRFNFKIFVLTFALILSVSSAAYALCYNFQTAATDVPGGTRQYQGNSYKLCMGTYWVDYYCPDSTWTATMRRYWKLDEYAGTSAADSSVNAGTATVSFGGGTGQWTPGTGYVNGALYFDSGVTYMNAGGGAVGTDLDNIFGAGAANANASISAWIYPTGLGENNNGQIIGKDNGTANLAVNGWVLRLTNTGGTYRIEFQVDGATDLVRRSATNAIVQNTWNHVVLTWDGVITTANSVHIYVNGTEVSYTGGATTNGAANKVTDAAYDMIIGNNRVASLTRTFSGAIDEVYVFNGILTATERSTLRSRGCARLAACATTTGTTQFDTATNRYNYCDGTNLMNLGCPVAATATDPADPVTPPTSTGLLGWWRLDEASGTFADSSGNGWTGTAVNPSGARLSYNNSGKINGSVGLVPSDDSVDNNDAHINLGSSFDIPSMPYTLSAWVNPTDYNDWRAIIGKRSSNSPTTSRFQWGTVVTTGALFIDNAASSVSFSYVAPTNTWTHLAVVVTTTSATLYVNGSFYETVFNTFALGTGAALTANANIGDTGEYDSGTPGPDGDPYKGYLDDVRVYSGALTASDIATIYGYSLTNGLVGHWKLDETSGTSAADASGYAHTGTLTNGPTWASTSGRIKGGLTFDDNDDYVTIADSNRLDVSSFTLSAWGQRNSLGNDDFIIEKSTVGNGNYFMYIDGGNFLKCGFYASGGFREDYTSVAANTFAGRKHLYTCTFDDVTDIMSIYLDGNLIQTSTIGGGLYTPAQNNDAVVIGRSPQNNAFTWNGILDDVRVYNRALAGSEVSALFKSAGPIAYLKLDEASGTSAADTSGNANTGTLTNGAAFAPTGGKINGAVTVDGTNDHIVLANEGNFDFSKNQPFSVSLWVNRSSLTTEDAMFGKQTGGNTGFVSYIYPSTDPTHPNALAFTFSGSGGGGDYISAVTTAPAITTAATWYHVTVTYDGTGLGAGIRIYVNGTNTSLTVTSSGPVSGNGLNNIDFVFGTDDVSFGTPDMFGGSIDHGQVYDRVLSATEVTSIYNQGLTSGLISHWKMDESGGLIAVDSVGGYNGILQGNPPYFGPTYGKVNGALYLDGATSSVPVTTSAYSALTQGSVAVWIKPSGMSGFRGFFSSTTGPLIEMAVANNDSIYIYTSVSGACNIQAYIPLPNPTQWHHFVYVVDGTGNKWYLDGVQVTPTYSNGNASSLAFLNQCSSGNDFMIGGTNSGSEIFQGYMDELRVYSTPLSASDVSKLYTATAGSVCQTYGSCGSAGIGTIQYDANPAFLKWCDGTNWLPMTKPP